ncbi:MAG: S-layer protein [Sulfolobaceae archaeon]|nr:S-layer protein [Sulfolobaceae archaeon]
MNYKVLLVSGFLILLITGFLSPLMAQAQPVGSPTFLAYPHAELIAGGETFVPITVTLVNTGGTAYNVNITPLSSYPFKPVANQSSIIVPELSTGQEVNVTFLYDIANNVSLGFYKLYLNLTYLASNGLPGTQKISTSIPILGYVNFTIKAIWGSTTSPLVVEPGESMVPLTLIIMNTGNVLASNVTITFKSGYPIKFLTNSTTIGYVPAGQFSETTVYADVYTNASAGVYNIPITVHYFTNAKQTVMVEVPINAGNFSVDAVWGTPSSPLTVGPGETDVPLTLIIFNTGSTTVANVSVSLTSTYPVYFLESSATVGYIPVGGYNEVTVYANIAKNATGGVYHIPITIHYFSGAKYKTNFTVLINNANFSVEAIWGTPSSPMVVAPGETMVPLTFIIFNTGQFVASNVSLTFTSRFPVKFLESSATVGYIPVGGYNEVTVYANVYNNATVGIYTIPVTIHYFDGSIKVVNVTISISGNVSITLQTVWGTPSSPITASPGEQNVPLTIIFRNTGSVTASNVSIYFIKHYPINFSKTFESVGFVPAGEINEITVTATVAPNATPGIYEIPVIVHYFSMNVTEYMQVVIYSPNITITVVTLPPQVFPGFFDVRLVAILLNYGEGIAENSTISISSPFEVITQQTLKIGVIPTGTPINTTFLINVPNDTKPGTYYVNFTVRYDGGKLVYSYPLKIYPKANLIITNVYYPTLNPGSSKVPITVTIKNIGNSTAKNVRAILGSSDAIYPYVSSSNPLMALTASEASLGDIKPGQEINVTFIIEVSSGANTGKYQIPLTLVWNQTGSLYPFVQNDMFNVTVSPTIYQQFVSKYLSNPLIDAMAAIVIILLIVVIVVAVRASRRSANK